MSILKPPSTNRSNQIYCSDSTETRMHSSRMRTVRSSSHVYPSMHWAAGCVCVYPRMHCAGGCLPGGICPGEVSALGVYPSMHWDRHLLPVNRMTDRCKTLPCRNYVADGNNSSKTLKITDWGWTRRSLLLLYYT